MCVEPEASFVIGVGDARLIAAVVMVVTQAFNLYPSLASTSFAFGLAFAIAAGVSAWSFTSPARMRALMSRG